MRNTYNYLKKHMANALEHSRKNSYDNEHKRYLEPNMLSKRSYEGAR